MKKFNLVVILLFSINLLIGQTFQKTTNFYSSYENNIIEFQECNFIIQLDVFDTESNKVIDIFYAPLLDESLFFVKHLNAVKNINNTIKYNGILYSDDQIFFVEIIRNNLEYKIILSNYILTYIYD